MLESLREREREREREEEEEEEEEETEERTTALCQEQSSRILQPKITEYIFLKASLYPLYPH